MRRRLILLLFLVTCLLTILPFVLFYVLVAESESSAQNDSAAVESSASGLDEDDAKDASAVALVFCMMSLLIVVAMAIVVRAGMRTPPPERKTGQRDRKRKRKRSSGGPNAKGLAIEDAVRDRMTDFAALGDPDPVIHKLSTYVAGDPHFDESFPIERGREFLGECGLGIAGAVNRYASDKVMALEVWLFDQNDSRTVTQVLASDHAAGTPSVSAELGRKGLVIRAEQDAVTELETATLRLRARVLSVQYGFSDTLPARSFFEHIVVEIAVFAK